MAETPCSLGGPGGQGTSSHITPQLKILPAAMKTEDPTSWQLGSSMVR